MHNATYTVNGITLNTYRTDGDKPPVVLIHGFTDSALCWQSLITHLSEKYSVFAYDSRGHGKSSRVTTPYTIADLSAECSGLIDQLGVGRVGLIGHSMGAAIALGVCATHPALVEWVVLEDPPLYAQVDPSIRDMEAWKQGIQMFQAAPRDMVVDYYRANDYKNWSEVDLQTRVDARLELDTAVFDWMDWGASPRWQDTVTAIQCRGLLLTGNTDKGAITSAAIADALHNLWTACQVVYTPDASHHIRCGTPTAYYQALEHFLSIESQ